MVTTSLSRGTFLNVDAPAGSSAAAISGSAAFLEPLTRTSPARRRPPSITILSIAGPRA
jgi:hypothetical protein